TINAPVVRDRKGEYREVLEELRQEGFTRVKVDGEQRLLEEEIVLDKKFKHTIEVVVDRLVMKEDIRTRLAQSIETAAALADALDRRGRARAVVGRQHELLRVGDPGDRRPLRDRPGHAVAGPARGAPRPVPERDGRRARLRPVPQPDGAQALLHARLRGDRQE